MYDSVRASYKKRPSFYRYYLYICSYEYSVVDDVQACLCIVNAPKQITVKLWLNTWNVSRRGEMRSCFGAHILTTMRCRGKYRELVASGGYRRVWRFDT
jgi:hypothetical protein